MAKITLQSTFCFQEFTSGVLGANVPTNNQVTLGPGTWDVGDGLSWVQTTPSYNAGIASGLIVVAGANAATGPNSAVPYVSNKFGRIP